MRSVLLVALGALISQPVSAADLFGGGSALSSYDKSLIRKPVRGRLKNAPRTPSFNAEPEVPVGVRVDIYQPGIYATGTYPSSPYTGMARSAAMRHGVPVDIFMKLVTQESNWNPQARSHKGAIGLAQLMPATARTLGVNPRDPRQNLEGGARYLATQYRKFRDWRLALAAYNAGPGAVEKYDGVPPYRETQQYVAAILGK